MNNLIYLILLIWSYKLTNCCSDTKNKPQSVEERAQQAETIIYAEAVQIYPWRSLDPSFNIITAEFRMLCPLKNEEKFVTGLKEITDERVGDLEEYKLLFNVTELGSAPGRCVNTKVELKHRYFLFIRHLSEEEKEVNQYPHAFAADAINQEAPVLEDTEDHRNSLKYITVDCKLPNLWDEESDSRSSVQTTMKPKEKETRFIPVSLTEGPDDIKIEANSVIETTTFMADRDLKDFPGNLQHQKQNPTEISTTSTSAAAVQRASLQHFLVSTFIFFLTQKI